MGVKRYLLRLLSRRRFEEDLEQEIQSHFETLIERRTARGESIQEARRAVRVEFESGEQVKEKVRDAWFGAVLEATLRDIQYGTRALRRSPVFTLIAVLTLALGIGANTAIFSLLNAVLLRDLPVRSPGQLVLFGPGAWVGSTETFPNGSWQLFSYPFFREFRDKNQVFSGIAAVDSILLEPHARIAGGGSMEKVQVELVSGSYFQALGVEPALGRVLTDGDDRTPGGHPVAVASYSWWNRRFSRNPGVLGINLTINSTVYTVVGVAPREFFGITVGQSPDLWIPLAMEKQVSPGWNGLEDRRFQSLYIIGRRKPGVGAAQASANTNLLFKQILREYAGPKPTAKDLESIRRARIDLTPASKGLARLRRQFSVSLWILMVVVALVLLIACANVANLLLVRAAGRRREFAVRMSIGATRGRLIRQLLVESGLLGMAGGALGVMLSWGASRSLLRMVSPNSQALPIDVAPDARILGFTLVVAVLTVLLSGLTPAFQATGLKLSSSLNEGRGLVGVSRNLLSRGIVVGQVSLSLMLLAGASLFLRSLANLANVDTGFDKTNVSITAIDPIAAGYRVDARLESMMTQVEERVAAIPGVEEASFVFSTFGGGWTAPATVPGRPKSDDDPDVFHNIVGPGYLRLMKIPILFGRALSPRDNAASRKVAVVTEAMARAYFPGVSPIGRSFSLGNNPEWQNLEVVGVTKDVKFVGLKQNAMPVAFYPHAQHGMFLGNLFVRRKGNSKTLTQEIRNAVHAVDPNLPVSEADSLAEVVDGTTTKQRLVAQLSTAFGLLAAFLSCIGIYGVVSYEITRRTNEFGIRMALGAARAHIFRVVIAETARLVLTGAALGLVFALVSGRWVQSQLYGLKSYDPLSIGGALIAMAAVALLAAYLPALRAARIDPMAALRCE
jgi:predicted permease